MYDFFKNLINLNNVTQYTREIETEIKLIEDTYFYIQYIFNIFVTINDERSFNYLIISGI